MYKSTSEIRTPLSNEDTFSWPSACGVHNGEAPRVFLFLTLPCAVEAEQPETRAGEWKGAGQRPEGCHFKAGRGHHSTGHGQGPTQAVDTTSNRGAVHASSAGVQSNTVAGVFSGGQIKLAVGFTDSYM